MHFLNIQSGGKDRSRTRPKIQVAEIFTPYQLRHTYCSSLYDAGVDVKTAQKLMGHADIIVTMRIYTHLSKEKELENHEKAMEYFDAMIEKSNSPCSNRHSRREKCKK